MIIPSGEKALGRFSQDIMEACRASSGARGAAYRTYGQWIETGRMGGPLALANMLFAHEERLAAHLFSPTALRFSVDFENHYGAEILAHGEMAARVLTREWERQNVDQAFGQAVRMSLDYGAAILKQTVDWQIDDDGKRTFSAVRGHVVAPWNFGVYNESRTALDQSMEAMCETVWLTRADVWRRISHLDGAEKLFQKIVAAAQKNDGVSAPTSFMHQVLSTAVLDVSLANATMPTPGGIVQLTNDPNAMSLGPEVGIELIAMHEMAVWDDDLGDWTTIQFIEPDIVVAPRLRKVNLFAPKTLQYQLVQPNQVAGYFWGRSEIVDLMMLQQWLTTTTDDIKRIFGTQVDKVLGFVGVEDLTDERYVQFRTQGWQTFAGPNAKIQDLTPQMPANALEMVNLIMALMDKVSGFPSVLRGEGEPGLRTGAQAGMLERNASPRLRDRALTVERQCAEAADATLAALEAKDAQVYWTEPGKEEQTAFFLAQLPRDRRVVVDSHSSSPTFKTDHQQLIAFLAGRGFMDPISVLEELDVPNRDQVIERYKAATAAKQRQFQALAQADPQGALKALEGHGGGRKKGG